mgnify:CR=1 FL=1
MKSTLRILTLAAAAVCVAQPVARGQVVPGPSYDYYGPAGIQAGTTNWQVGTEHGYVAPAAYATAVGTCADCDGNGDACKTPQESCGCLACRQRALCTRTFASVEYMHWWNKGRHLPALVTTVRPGVTNPIPSQTYLDSPDHQLLFGDDNIGGDLQAAGRLTVGLWLDDSRSLGIGARTFGVEGCNSGYYAESDGTVPLARPFVRTGPPFPPSETSLLVSFPANPGVPIATITGDLGIWSENEVFGSEVFLRYLVDQGLSYRLDFLVGYHFTRINDDLLQTQQSVTLGTVYDIQDLFRASNEFHGGEFGLLGEWHSSRWTFSALGKISFGNMEQRLDVSGQTNVTSGATTTSYEGGLFAQPTNIGTYKRDTSVWLPEANFRLAYDLTDRLSLHVGYTFMYWTRVALAGDQLDRNINETQFLGGQLVGSATPRYLAADTDFWVQSIDIGASWNY